MALGETDIRSEEHTSELQSHDNLVCRLLLEKKKTVKEAGDHGDGWGWGARGGAPCARAPARSAYGTPSPTVFSEARSLSELLIFFFNDTATTEIYTLSLHDALPI